MGLKLIPLLRNNPPVSLQVASLSYFLISIEQVILNRFDEFQLPVYILIFLVNFTVYFLLLGKSWARKILIGMSVVLLFGEGLAFRQELVGLFSFSVNVTVIFFMFYLLLFSQTVKRYFGALEINDDEKLESSTSNNDEKKADREKALIVVIPLFFFIFQLSFPWNKVSSYELAGILSSDFVKIWTLGITLALTPLVGYLIHITFRVGISIIVYLKIYAFFFAVMTYMNIGEINIYYADKLQKPAVKTAVLRQSTRGNPGRSDEGCIRGACLVIVDPVTSLELTDHGYSYRLLNPQSKRKLFRGLKSGQQVKLFVRTGFFGAQWVSKVEFSFEEYIRNIGGAQNLRMSDFEALVGNVDQKMVDKYYDKWQRSCFNDAPENCRLASYISRVMIKDDSKTKGYLQQGCSSKDFLSCYNYFFYDGLSSDDKRYAQVQIRKMCDENQSYPESYIKGICKVEDIGGDL